MNQPQMNLYINYFIHLLYLNLSYQGSWRRESRRLNIVKDKSKYCSQVMSCHVLVVAFSFSGTDFEDSTMEDTEW